MQVSDLNIITKTLLEGFFKKKYLLIVIPFSTRSFPEVEIALIHPVLPSPLATFRNSSAS
jgi:hypothetical protein